MKPGVILEAVLRAGTNVVGMAVDGAGMGRGAKVRVGVGGVKNVEHADVIVVFIFAITANTPVKLDQKMFLS
eukprot:11099964-Ditylum_brightwellii.AAC.1